MNFLQAHFLLFGFGQHCSKKMKNNWWELFIILKIHFHVFIGFFFKSTHEQQGTPTKKKKKKKDEAKLAHTQSRSRDLN